MSSLSIWIGTRLATRLNNFLERAPLGWAFAEAAFAIWPDHPAHVRRPDVSFVRNGKLPGGMPGDGSLNVVPDIVAEIISPGDDAEGLEQKLIEYREAGIPLIWLIYPRTRTALVIRSDHVRRELTANDSLDGEDVLPGFSVRLGDLFPKPEQ